MAAEVVRHGADAPLRRLLEQRPKSGEPRRGDGAGGAFQGVHFAHQGGES